MGIAPMTTHIQATVGSRCYRSVLALAAAVAVVVTVVLGVAASTWIGRPFPGFFVFPNRVVASIGLPHWATSQDGTLYQRTVVALDHIPVVDGADVYRRVSAQPVGTRFAVTLRSGAATDTVAVRSTALTVFDCAAIFGTYVATGCLYLGLGLVGAWLFAGGHLGRALLFVGGLGGAYALSAVSIYDGATASLRLHALAEAFLAPAFVYLALVFPRERGGLTWPVVAVAWWLALALAIPYQILLPQPEAYSALHGACEAYIGVAGVALIVRLVVEHARAGAAAPPLLRAATAGALLGLGVPAVVLLLSGLGGGLLPVNVITVTGFLFPLCFGYGVVREGLARSRTAPAADPAPAPAMV